MTPYATPSYAYTYFCDRLRSDAYLNASTSDQVKALKMATSIIEELNFEGYKADPDQELQFPRGNDTEVPDAIKKACCEIAIKLLDDVDPDLENENLHYIKQDIGARVERDTAAMAPEHIREGVPSIRAWRLLKPFLVDPGHAHVTRES